MKKYIRLLRIKHYIKNFLIFLPLVFSGNLLNGKLFLITLTEFLAFSFIASAVYVFNDIQDVEKDRKHPVKKNRPIASGEISIKKAYLIFTIMLIVSLGTQTLLYKCLLFSFEAFVVTTLCLLLYLILNVIYSKWAKHIPIVDIFILAFGFLIRVYFGGYAIQTPVSDWLYLTILALSFYLVVGKRRGEYIKSKDSRPVLKYYSKEFLDKFMYVFLALTLVFYSLWCILGVSDNVSKLLIYSIIIVVFIVMRYSLIVESDSLGDPVDVLTHDKTLIIATIIYIVYVGGVLYAETLGL